MTKLVELNADVSSIPVQDLQQELGQYRKMYYKLDFEIEMKLSSGSLEFAIIYRGKSYTNVKQTFV